MKGMNMNDAGDALPASFPEVTSQEGPFQTFANGAVNLPDIGKTENPKGQSPEPLTALDPFQGKTY